MPERRYSGRSASAGIAIGSLVKVTTSDERSVQSLGTPSEEEMALRRAIAKAAADLEALADVASGDGAEILAFQVEMLSDPALIEDILKGIEKGQAALTAWDSSLEAQIDDFAKADDDYFRARASDLDDLKDRVGRALSGSKDVAPDLIDGALLLDQDLTPSRFLALDFEKLSGIVLRLGSVNSHVSMLARTRGLPMIVGLDQAINDIGTDGEQAIIDAEDGLLIVAPTATTRTNYENKLSAIDDQASMAEAKKHQSAITKDGQAIDVLINVDHPAAVDDDTLTASDGVGLLRTEFLFMGRGDLPDEEEQFLVYRSLLDRLDGRPSIIRTLDIGGDKPLPGVQQAKETNPFLGLRGIRFCLAHETIFKVQVRALLRAADQRSLKVMLPMVCTQSEIEQASRIFSACFDELQAKGVPAAIPPIGIMVETPAAAIAIDQLDAAFYSIGSNDLIQYVMAAARDATDSVADLLDPVHPAIGRLISQVVAHGRKSGKEVSLCGDMASDPSLLPLLLHTGLRKISVAPASLGRIKAKIAQIDLQGSSTKRP